MPSSGRCHTCRPSSCRGQPIDHRTDLFSLGVLLYELATGDRPFIGGNAAAVSSSILRDTPPPLVDVRADVPGELARIVAHCLRKDVRERYQTARDVYNNLRELYRDLEGRSRELRSSSSSHAQARADLTGSASGVLPGSQGSSAISGRAPSEAGGASSAVAVPPGVQSQPAVSVTIPETVAHAGRPRRKLALAACLVVALIGAGYWITRRAGDDHGPTAAARRRRRPRPRSR